MTVEEQASALIGELLIGEDSLAPQTARALSEAGLLRTEAFIDNHRKDHVPAAEDVAVGYSMGISGGVNRVEGQREFNRFLAAHDADLTPPRTLQTKAASAGVSERELLLDAVLQGCGFYMFHKNDPEFGGDMATCIVDELVELLES